MRRFAWLPLTFLSLTPLSLAAQSFDGFVRLSTPRQEVPIGARWQQGIGPDAPGVSPSSVRVSRSYSALTADSNFRTAVQASIISWLGLSGDLRRSTEIRMEDVEVHTLADMREASLEPGNHILYEAIRVGKLRVRTTAGGRTAVQAALQRSIGSGSVEAEGGNTFVADGVDLFVGYRVIELRAPRVSRNSYRIRGAQRQVMGNYEVSFNIAPYVNCICRGRAIGASATNLGECAQNNPLRVYVENRTGGPTGGGGTQQAFDVFLRSNTQPSLLIASRARSGYFEVDRMVVRAWLAERVQRDCMMIEGSEFNGASRVEISRIRYPFRALQQPRAPGW